MLQVKDGIKYRFYIQMMPLVNNVSQPQHIDINISDQITKVFFWLCHVLPLPSVVMFRFALRCCICLLNSTRRRYSMRRSDHQSWTDEYPRCDIPSIL